MADQQTFYHISRRKLRKGTTLTSGTYGERIRREDFLKENYKSYIKEEIFEDIRSQHYPDAPSRFNCVFLFPELSIAKEFYANLYGYKNYLYEVKVVEKMPYIVEMDLLRCAGMPYETITSNAHKYWKQLKHPNSGTLEVLCGSDAKVEQLILEPSQI